MTAVAVPAERLAGYALGLGDDALLLAHRCGEWISHAPQIEEDIALGNIGLDLLGQARALLTHAGQCAGDARDEDDLAYLRDAADFRNIRLVEQPNGDFAVTMARLLAFATYQLALYERLQASSDTTIGGVAAKAVKEVSYHREHAAGWVVRLGDGTAESARRMQAGLDAVWPYVDELFADEGLDPELVPAGAAVPAAGLREEWDASVDAVLVEAGLDRPVPTWHAAGGRLGQHGAALDELLAEMQQVHRAHPGASW